ncbi:hypothetical protein BGX21_005048 [Mortierella sp. AD011]|nr:hypothetical protein BGX20_010953 [Mortierella sp. AD010]KAF9400069.1 hypothetical protein BGX21_005048 [Mortierella sp. AD011]
MNEPWPISRTNRLLAVDPTAKGKSYHGPYNMILISVFNEPRYEISPQAWPLESRTAIDYVLEYLVQVEDGIPVLGLEIKRASDLNFIERRSAVDEQIRDRFRELAPQIRTPRFYMISAIGTQCCVYTYERRANGITITPPAIYPTDHSIVKDFAPAARWDIDLGTVAGRNRLNEYFNDVKNMCNDL